MPAEVTWQLIGYSFIPLVLGVGLIVLALRVTKRAVLRAPLYLVGGLFLAYWLLMVFVAAYPTIHQTNGEPRCYEAGGEEIECPPEFWEMYEGDWEGFEGD